MPKTLLILSVSLAAVAAHAADRQFVVHPFFVLTTEEAFTASVATGDFNGDGALDILETNGRHWRQANRIHFNNGEGRLGHSVLMSAHEAPSYQLVPGDFDGDGDLDAIEATDRAGAWLYRNRGDGSFTIENTKSGPVASRSAAALDADQDGDLDVFLSNRGEAGTLLLNRGDGTFDAASVETSESGSVGSFAADFNADGADDLLLAVRDGDSALVLLNNGRGQFTIRKSFNLAGVDIRSVTAGDLNGDQLTDIVYGVIGGQSLVLLGDGKGGIKKQVRFGPADSNAFGLALSDLDGDGDLDIVMARSQQSNIVFLNDGDGATFESVELEEGRWTAPGEGEPFPDSYGVVAADLNGDGFDEIVIANSLSPNPVYRNRAARRD
ncbi:MAG: VCBS repeat-containing protein [Pseudomonadota bacterium]